MADTATVTLDPAVMAQIARDAATAAVQASESRRAAQEQEQARAEAASTRDADPLRQVLLKEIGPDIAHAKLLAADAQDAARFYAGNVEAGKYREAVEAKSAELMARGEPMDRQSIFFYLRGKDFDKFRQEANEAEKVQQDRAGQAGMVIGGGAGAQRPDMQLSGDPWAMSAEELEKAMTGRTF